MAGGSPCSSSSLASESLRETDLRGNFLNFQEGKREDEYERTAYGVQVGSLYTVTPPWQSLNPR